MKTCRGCDKEISARKTFCSAKCQRTERKVRTLLNSPLCSHCRTGRVGLASTKYCSTVCATQARTQEVIDKWLVDHNTATRKDGLAKTIKTYLIEQSGNKCSICGWDEVNPFTGKVPLAVDHIDGNCHNNSPENLAVLCPNCHSLTPTYKALNPNSKRPPR